MEDNQRKYNHNYFLCKGVTKLGVYSSEETELEEILSDLTSERSKQLISALLKGKLNEKSAMFPGTLEVAHDNSSATSLSVFCVLLKSEVQKATEASKECTVSHLLCFVLEMKSWNLLGLFTNEMIAFARNFRDLFNKNEPTSVLQEFLSNWFRECVRYIPITFYIPLYPLLRLNMSPE